MAVECFLKIEQPDLKGEAAALPGQIDVVAWQWAASQAGTMHTGTGGGAGKANAHDLSILKFVDSASPNLMQAVISGKQFGRMTLTCRKASGADPVNYLVVDMEKVIITSLKASTAGDEERFTENVTLNFAQYRMTY